MREMLPGMISTLFAGIGGGMAAPLAPLPNLLSPHPRKRLDRSGTAGQDVGSVLFYPRDSRSQGFVVRVCLLES